MISTDNFLIISCQSYYIAKIDILYLRKKKGTFFYIMVLYFEAAWIIKRIILFASLGNNIYHSHCLTIGSQETKPVLSDHLNYLPLIISDRHIHLVIPFLSRVFVGRSSFLMSKERKFLLGDYCLKSFKPQGLVLQIEVNLELCKDLVPHYSTKWELRCSQFLKITLLKSGVRFN